MKLILGIVFLLSAGAHASCLKEVGNSTGISSSRAYSIIECEHTKEIIETFRKQITKETYNLGNDFESFEYDYTDYKTIKATLRNGSKFDFSGSAMSYVKDYYEDLSNKDIILIDYVDSHHGDKFLTNYILLINKDETELISIKKKN